MANAICLLYDMCRLCLDEPGTYKLLENDCLIQDILLCTNIPQISYTDNLPQNICMSCIYKIKAAKDLRRYSTKNDLYMKSLLENNSKVVRKIARPKIPLRLVIPLDEVVSSSTETKDRGATISQNNHKSKNKNSQNDPPSKCSVGSETAPAGKSKISVRSLADINSSVLQTSSPEKEEVSRNNKIIESDSPECIKAESKKKNKIKCDSSSEKNTSDKKPNSTTGDSVENKCDICQKRYLTRKKLYLHQRSHTKKLYCPLDACGKTFATKGDLQKHIRSHTGEKPFKCDLCDKSFAQKVTLRSHKEAVHLEKM